MTNPSIISTKINIPHSRADVVSRPRVLEILNEGLTRPSALILVSASAGYGKTTLVMSWLWIVNRRYAWLALGTEDDNLPRFIAYLIASLQKLHPSIGQTAQQMLAGFGSDSLQVDAVLSALIPDLSKFAEPVLFVLEDYHCIESSAIHAFVEALIQHSWPHLQIILTTRRDPPLPLARWRARNQLTEIRTADLQFTLDEAAEFLQRTMELQLSKQDVKLLEEQTEGWVAGLQLAGLSIRNHQGKSSRWRIEGGHRDIADYLMSEVVSQLSTERREFLLQTSLTNSLNASLCNTILERTDSQSMLEALEAENLFIVSLDETREWFRYHHLFTEFLRKRLLSAYSQSRVRDLYLRTSRWLAKNGYFPEAIDHALTAKDYDYAALLIAPQCEQWMRRGEISTILKYLNQLPKELAWNQWGLCLWYSWAYAVTGNLELAALWTSRLDALVQIGIEQLANKTIESLPIDLQNAYVQVLGIRSVIARQNGDFAEAIALDEQALKLVPDSNMNLRTIVSALLSSATLEAGNFDHAETILHSAHHLSKRVGNPFLTFSILLNESALSVMRGQLHRAYDLNMEALHLAQAESMERLVFLPHFRLGRLHYFWNELSQARQYITLALEQASVTDYPNPTIRGYITLAWIQNAENQYPQALQTLDHAEKIALKQHELESAEWVRGVRAQLQLSAGEHETVARWMKFSGWESFSPSKSGPTFSDESFFSFCQILIASEQPHEWKRVKRLLEWRLMDSERQKRGSTILKIRLMQALLHHVERHADLAMASLFQSLEIAEPENYLRPFLDEGRTLMPLLRRVPYAHVRRNFSQHIFSGASNNRREDFKSLSSPLSEQEINILRLLAEGYSNPEIATRRMLAVSTVRWYVKQIFRKLGVHNRTQAATQARTLNLL
jgi:LuxR family transcriptional regulator, maltose regulon positive regulatory protein